MDLGTPAAIIILLVVWICRRDVLRLWDQYFTKAITEDQRSAADPLREAKSCVLRHEYDRAVEVCTDLLRRQPSYRSEVLLLRYTKLASSIHVLL